MTTDKAACLGENFTHDRWAHWSDEQWADALMDMLTGRDNTEGLT